MWGNRKLILVWFSVFESVRTWSWWKRETLYSLQMIKILHLILYTHRNIVTTRINTRWVIPRGIERPKIEFRNYKPSIYLSFFSFISNSFGIISNICGYTYLWIELREGQPNLALHIRGFYNCPIHTLTDMINNYKPNGNEGHK